MEGKMKPNNCQFCGSENVVTKSVYEDIFVECEDCAMMSPDRQTEEAAIAAWNRIKVEPEQ
jgi:Lar family restriction alleviation protein